LHLGFQRVVVIVSGEKEPCYYRLKYLGLLEAQRVHTRLGKLCKRTRERLQFFRQGSQEFRDRPVFVVYDGPKLLPMRHALESLVAQLQFLACLSEP
jgi:hypothetical protein